MARYTYQNLALLVLLLVGLIVVASPTLVSARTEDAAGGEEEESNFVVKLTDETHDDAIKSTGKLTFIKYFAPWCGHCKRLAPVWAELAELYKDDLTVDIAVVDCTVHKTTCASVGVKGYPTLKLYEAGKELDTYKGARSLEALKGFITDSQQGKM